MAGIVNHIIIQQDLDLKRQFNYTFSHSKELILTLNFYGSEGEKLLDEFEQLIKEYQIPLDMYSFKFVIEGNHKNQIIEDELLTKIYRQISFILSLFSNSQKLQLDIGVNNKMGSQNAQLVFDAVSKYQNLNSFCISIGGQNNIKGCDLNFLFQNMKQIKNLKNLSFAIENENEFGLEGCKGIGQFIQQNQELQHLNLRLEENCGFKQQESQILFQYLNHLKQLQRFEFYLSNGNKIDEQGAKLLQQFLSQNLQLRYLALYFDLFTLTPQAPQHLSQILQNLVKIETLKIFIGSSNNFEEESFYQLIKNIQSNVLRELYVKVGSSNQSNAKGINELGKVFKNNGKTLEQFRLLIGSKNLSKAEDLTVFYEGFQHLEQLKYFYLTIQSKNEFHGQSFGKFGQFLTNCKQLQTLIVDVQKVNEQNQGDYIDFLLGLLEQEISHINDIAIQISGVAKFIFQNKGNVASINLEQNVNQQSISSVVRLVKIFNNSLKTYQMLINSAINNSFLDKLQDAFSESDTVQQIAVYLASKQNLKPHYATRLFQKMILNKNLLQSQLLIPNYIEFLYQIDRTEKEVKQNLLTWKRLLSITLKYEEEIKRKFATSIYNLIISQPQNLTNLEIENLKRIKLPALQTIAEGIFELPYLFSFQFKNVHNVQHFGQPAEQNADPIVQTKKTQLEQMVKKYINDRTRVFKNFMNFYQKNMLQDHKHWEKFLPGIADKMKLMIPFTREQLLQGQNNRLQYNNQQNEDKQIFKDSIDFSLEDLLDKNLIETQLSQDFI